MFDYWGTVIFAIAMALWSVFFLEFWKRQQFYLQYEWDVLEYEVVEETVRPEFETKMRRVWEKAKETKKNRIFYENPITKVSLILHRKVMHIIPVSDIGSRVLPRRLQSKNEVCSNSNRAGYPSGCCCRYCGGSYILPSSCESSDCSRYIKSL